MYKIYLVLKHVCILATLIKYCDCIMVSELESNISITQQVFSAAVATWYGPPNGDGSEGGACGFKSDISGAPFYGMISAGNAPLFNSGYGCGACYEVRCTTNLACSGNPVMVTITDECGCDNENVHFDLSGKAFGAMAKPSQEEVLRNAGTFPIQYRKVECKYPNQELVFKIDSGSNPYYLAFAVECELGDGDVSLVELKSEDSGNNDWWSQMQHSWGAVWKADLQANFKAPFSIRLTMANSKLFIVANRAIPANWAPGQTYTASGTVDVY